MSQQLILFARHPVPGQTKTRLGAGIGMERAAQFAEAFLLDLLDELRSDAWHRTIAFSPKTAASRAWFAECAVAEDTLWPQPPQSLGSRLNSACEQAFTHADRVVIVGADCPLLTAGLVHTAFEQLTHHDCVLGPASDGGYYLIGLRRPLPDLFTDIPWSTAQVLPATLARLVQLDATHWLLPERFDIDNIADLERLRDALCQTENAAARTTCRRTSVLLERHP
ncbi:MAG: TIGR04282 family arsenosugar biosynthesis glycosyltransferase [Planctomycetaceae bacterium]|nr:TIGR04282 family arsenosugar biosynthesis glycosyltransferase [Planctomycetaceae bacterium]